MNTIIFLIVCHKTVTATPLTPPPPQVDDKGPALSTRSQKPIVDKEWEDLESDLLMVAPVIEPEIYDVLNPDLDEDYTDFLTSLYKGV